MKLKQTLLLFGLLLSGLIKGRPVHDFHTPAGIIAATTVSSASVFTAHPVQQSLSRGSQVTHSAKASGATASLRQASPRSSPSVLRFVDGAPFSAGFATPMNLEERFEPGMCCRTGKSVASLPSIKELELGYFRCAYEAALPGEFQYPNNELFMRLVL